MIDSIIVIPSIISILCILFSSTYFYIYIDTVIVDVVVSSLSLIIVLKRKI